LEVPAQVVPAPAAQSFLPFMATPKHLSLSGWAATGPAAADSVVKAVANAMAMAATGSAEVVWFMEAPGVWMGAGPLRARTLPFAGRGQKVTPADERPARQPRPARLRAAQRRRCFAIG
jgi:hypothetical protein